MRRYYRLFNIRALFFSLSALLLLASCSSYQYAGYDNDGIYSSDRDEAYTANEYEESYEDALYYKQLFAQKSEQFASVPEEGAVFTDIESYSSGAYDEDFMQEDLDYTVGRAAWGSDPDEISINIYQDPFYRPYYNPYYAGFYDPFWGYPYYNHRYGYPYGYYSNWSIGFGFGWSSWGYGYPYYPSYWRHHYPYYGSHYYYPYYSSRNVAYNTSRRNSYRDHDGYSRTNINTRSTRVQSYANPRNVRAARSSSDYRTNSNDRTYRTRSTRVRSNSSPARRNSTYSRSRSSREVRAVRSTRTRSNNSNSTRVRSTRSSSGNNNSAVRSSSSSSRSSGTSSRSSRSRGN